MLLVPLETIKSRESCPRKLTLVLNVSPSLIIRLSPREVSSKILMTEEVTMNLPLRRCIPLNSRTIYARWLGLAGIGS